MAVSRGMDAIIEPSGNPSSSPSSDNEGTSQMDINRSPSAIETKASFELVDEDIGAHSNATTGDAWPVNDAISRTSSPNPSTPAPEDEGATSRIEWCAARMCTLASFELPGALEGGEGGIVIAVHGEVEIDEENADFSVRERVLEGICQASSVPRAFDAHSTPCSAGEGDRDNMRDVLCGCERVFMRRP